MKHKSIKAPTLHSAIRYAQYIIMRLILLIIILSSSYISTYSQRRMTKEEVAIEWNRSKKVDLEKYKKLYPEKFTKLPLEAKITECIDSLIKENIDTIGLYSIKYVGYGTDNPCNGEFSPWEAYLQWKKNGSTFHQTIRENCHFVPIAIKYSTIINYYNNCSRELKEEVIYPVIEGEFDSEGYPSISIKLIDHQPEYKIYSRQSNDSIFVCFDEDAIIDKTSLFYNDNNSTRIISWKNIIENQVNEIESKQKSNNEEKI